MDTMKVNDYEHFGTNPVVFIDVHMYKNGEKTRELVTKEMIDEAKPREIEVDIASLKEMLKESFSIENL